MTTTDIRNRLPVHRKKCQPTRAFTLVELLVAVAVMAVLAGMVVSRMQPSIHESLTSTARIMIADLHRVRDLAVATSSHYRIDFDLQQNEYRLQHSGTDAALDTLPSSPFGRIEPDTGHWIQSLDSLLQTGVTPEITLVRRLSSPPQTAASVEFGPLGETTNPEPTVIWLSAGSGQQQRFLSITVQPVTGLCSIGEVRTVSP